MLFRSPIVLVAALPLYRQGVRLAVPGTEVWGRVAIERDSINRTVIATLQKMQSNIPRDHALPPLYEPTVKRLTEYVLELRGIERDGNGWHLQLWSCRFATELEAQTVLKTDAASNSGLSALYLRLWSMAFDATATASHQDEKDVAEIVEMLEIPLAEVWPFLDWASRSRRCTLIHGGRDGLGRVWPKMVQSSNTSPVATAIPDVPHS